MTTRLDDLTGDGGAAIASLTAGYRPLPGIYDEMVDSAGVVRAHWLPLLAAFSRLGAEGLERRFALADQHLASSGVFYRVYEDRNSVARAYRLSHVPLIVSADDWVHISAGLSQRADLLETILADAYGAGGLFASGKLPAALVAGSPEYLRPLRGVRPRSGRHLNFYAADIGRDAQGRWWVLRDRTQAPSGTGYALENRIALSRGLGEIFRSYGVERLASYFDSMRSMLGLQREAGDAGICLLTPGPHNETYFEHVYLSRYLGFRLVEGQDLSVQDDKVMLRTVGGFRPVNVLVRRLDADFADPMELNTNSRLGVPGLIGALRAGNVSVLNALGSGLMEAPALLGFLPALAPQLSGTELLMPNVATWWCGQPAERQFVLDHLESLVVTSALSSSVDLGRVDPAVTGADEALSRLRRDISLRGIDYIGQQPVHLSTMPVWERGHLVPRPFVLRVYLTATPSGWQVMPGGMALVGERADDTQITMQRGARTADVWTLSDNSAAAATLLRPPEAIQIRRASAALTSRAADNLYWFARYLERAEATLRVVRALSNRIVDQQQTRPDAAALTDILLQWGCIGAGTTSAAAVTAALSDRRSSDSVASLVQNAMHAGAVIRNRFPIDGWRALEDTNRILATGVPANSDALAIEGLGNSLLRNFAAITGVELDNMNRLSGWRFLKLGARIERAILVSRLARRLAGPEAPADCLETLLEINSSEVTYRVRYPHGAARAPVLDLVLLDDSNPRSLAFAIGRIAEHLGALDQMVRPGSPAAAAKPLDDLHTRFAALDLQSLDGGRLVAIENLLMQISNLVTARYFDLSDGPRAAGDEQ